ncbi:hypothetical protein PseudUWO311_11145 [Pseudanabaena sp. UWO311]|uniref:hypothetical protein n=1 Tax=Pseudanabaena sp. UWO311 TaxID=2487337 RepID=UPI001159DA93|nr:hypothetical protein [Pseudanabaena sp. UWO311]TYQ26659.1 hypothetical protein PseudUWO311_11145 [Pseudanabaena sp. UWO311]
MKLRILAIFFISIFSSAIAFAENTDLIPPPKHAESLNELPKLFENKNGLTDFREQLYGIPESDALGMDLPKGLTRKDIVKLVAPNEDINLAIAVGAKAFPYRLNSYVVIACFARPNQYKDLRFPERKSCKKKTGDRDPDDIIYLGLIEYDSIKSKSKLIAKSLPLETSWYFIISEQFRSDMREKRYLPPKGKYKEFDFAPFKVSDTQTAFGLRTGQTDGYSGGFGYFEVLTLFIVDNDQIINILSEPIYFYQNIAGSWNKDGTREHGLYEGKNVIVVLPSQTDGYYDLQIKSLDNEWQKTFAWDASLKRYLPSDRTATLNRILAEIYNLQIRGVTYY